MARLAQKVAIVTGGGQGVGLGIARTFVRHGASVIITGRTRDRLQAAVSDLAALGGTADFMVGTAGVRADARKAVETALDRFGGVDILVNNAQTSRPGTAFEDHDDELVDLTLQSGFYGTFHHMQEVLPAMRQRGGGSIINLGSREGIVGGVGFAAYAANKEAIRGLTRSTARELGQYNIRVNVICPAALSPIAIDYLAAHPEDAENYRKGIALGRFGDPEEDIGPVALFLASEDSRYITGQTVNADGGMVMG